MIACDAPKGKLTLITKVPKRHVGNVGGPIHFERVYSAQDGTVYKRDPVLNASGWSFDWYRSMPRASVLADK